MNIEHVNKTQLVLCTYFAIEISQLVSVDIINRGQNQVKTEICCCYVFVEKVFPLSHYDEQGARSVMKRRRVWVIFSKNFWQLRQVKHDQLKISNTNNPSKFQQSKNQIV